MNVPRQEEAKDAARLREPPLARGRSAVALERPWRGFPNPARWSILKRGAASATCRHALQGARPVLRRPPRRHRRAPRRRPSETRRDRPHHRRRGDRLALRKSTATMRRRRRRLHIGSLRCRRRFLARPRHRRARPPDRRRAAPDSRRGPSGNGSSTPRRCARSASTRRSSPASGHRHLHADLLRPAHRHLRRLRRRQVDAARHAGRRRRPSTRSSSRWSASAAARCANSSRTRSGEAKSGKDRRRRRHQRRKPDDAPPAPLTAMRVAEHFRDQGDSVLLVSIRSRASPTRCARWRRPPANRRSRAAIRLGLHRTAEAAGTGRPRPGGTGLDHRDHLVLVDGDDHNDPVADACAASSTAISCSTAPSPSRAAIRRSIRSPRSRASPARPGARTNAWSSAKLKAMISRFEDTRDIRLLGGYQPGADAELDIAVRQVPVIYEALTQSPKDGRRPMPSAISPVI
jgi:hypothetical protein